ncbi:hypothetical protein Acr_22g0006420 [Actinidia rufa]|uniref:NAC domain-containing protein n=1 Tax=Actinidia rufa TaxID=165716 RepID=A0A7J0GKK2_9ERIC|nr:hypothetical protein Acr_22g0006420 [Actinidia rufa]
MALPVPYGFTFNPKDHELIYLLLRKANGNSLPVDEHLIEECDLFGKDYLLLRKANGNSLPVDEHLIEECDLFGKEEPWKIFGRGTEKTRYFFCKTEEERQECSWFKLCSNGWQRIGGNQDGEGFGSMNCAENAILGRKRSRIEFMMDYDLPNLSAADAAVMLESIAHDQTTEYRFFNRKEPRIDGDQLMDLLLGAENCVPSLSEGVSKGFTQDDEAEYF